LESQEGEDDGISNKCRFSVNLKDLLRVLLLLRRDQQIMSCPVKFLGTYSADVLLVHQSLYKIPSVHIHCLLAIFSIEAGHRDLETYSLSRMVAVKIDWPESSLRTSSGYQQPLSSLTKGMFEYSMVIP
jgi:hypothetical protein